jgi:hypothetical protein
MKKKKKSQCKPATKKELTWALELEEVINRMPNGIWLFGTGGEIAVLKDPEDGNQNDETGCVNQDNIIHSILCHADGGAW